MNTNIAVIFHSLDSYCLFPLYTWFLVVFHRFVWKHNIYQTVTVSKYERSTLFFHWNSLMLEQMYRNSLKHFDNTGILFLVRTGNAQNWTPDLQGNQNLSTLMTKSWTARTKFLPDSKLFLNVKTKEIIGTSYIAI